VVKIYNPDKAKEILLNIKHNPTGTAPLIRKN